MPGEHSGGQSNSDDKKVQQQAHHYVQHHFRPHDIQMAKDLGLSDIYIYHHRLVPYDLYSIQRSRAHGGTDQQGINKDRQPDALPDQGKGNQHSPSSGAANQSLMDLVHQAGFQGQAANTMYAIVMAESGGRAGALNDNPGTGDLSYGLAQINMIGSMGPARLQEYGLSSNDDLYDPLTNLKVAYALSNHGQNFAPWSTYNSGAYQKFLGQSGAMVTGAGSTTPGAAAAAIGAAGGSTKLSAADFEQALGIAAGIFKAVPELHDLVQQAVSGGWSAAEFTQRVEQTDWWQNHNQAARNFISLQYQDPAQYKTEMDNARQQVSNLANQLGVQLNGDNLDTLARRFIIDGWDSSTLQRKVGRDYTGNGTPQGQAAQYQMELQRIYGDMGLPISNDALDNRTRQLLMGTQTVDTYQEAAKQAALGLYPGLAKQLNDGMTVKDVADPFIQTEANLLELNPNQITLSDPLIKRALQGTVTTNDAGKSTVSSTPLSEFESRLRNDPRWQHTQNAQDTISSALLHVGRDMGFEG